MCIMLKKFMSVFNFKNSIFARLFVVLLLVFTVAFAFSTLLWYTNTENLIYTSYTSHLYDLINRSNDKFEDDLRTLTKLAETLSKSEVTLSSFNDEILRPGKYRLNSYLNEQYFIHSIKGIAVTDNYGNVTSAGSSYVNSDYTNTAWYKDILDAKGKCCYISGKLFYYDSQTTRLIIGCAITTEGIPIGSVLLDLSNSLYSTSFGITSLNGAMRTIIYDNERNVLFTNDSTLTRETIDKFINSSPNQRLSNQLSEISIQNKKYLFSTQKISYTGWTSLMFFDKDIIDAEYTRVINYTMFFIIMALLIATFVAIFTSYVLSKKIHKLTDDIDNVNLEDIANSQKKFDTNSKDEIGIISAKIAEMVEKISGQFDEITYLTEQKRQSDMYMLKSQVNPHFLYNALNSIESLASLHNDKPISELTCSLISLLHYSVSTDDSLVTIGEELNYVKNYLRVMQRKFLDKINVIYDIEPGIELCKTQRMILQPIVENCIKHAFDDVADKRIFIKAAACDGEINITVTDNGIGAPTELMQQIETNSIPNGHLGLINVNRRIKLSFGEKYGLNILTIPGMQTSVIIKVPYIKDNEIKT